MSVPDQPGQAPSLQELALLKQRVAELEVALLDTQTQLDHARARQQQTEESLAESKAQTLSLLRAIPDLIMRISAAGVYLDFIEAKDIDLLISKTEDRIGKHVSEVLPAAIAQHYLNAIQQALQTGKTQVFEYRLQIHNKLGDYEARVVPYGVDEALFIVRDVTQRKQMEEALRLEKEKSERLLLNILPRPIAEQLKQGPSSIANHFDEATILFADIVGFTQFSTQLSPTELVNLLNTLFSKFDALAEQHGLEKIKTIGDAYMVVGGIPTPRADHAVAIAEMALDMQDAIGQFSRTIGKPFQMRIGINTGPVVAGVIGIKKFIYDLWGDAVNVASRMEAHGLAGSIQVTDNTYLHLKQQYQFETRGIVEIKGKGPMMTYFLVSRTSPETLNKL